MERNGMEWNAFQGIIFWNVTFLAVTAIYCYYYYYYYYYYQICQLGTGRHKQKAQACTRYLPKAKGS